MAEIPTRPSLRSHVASRLFGGVSGGVFRGMATLALGSGVGRVIGLAAIPVLTRLYSPEDFGVLAVFTALVAILAPLVTLRYALALPLPRNNGVAMNLLVLSFALLLGLTALVAAVLWQWGFPLLTLVSMEVLAPWWWLLALGVLGTATYELLTMWATRKRAYKVIAQTNVTQSTAGALLRIGMGLMAMQPLGLLAGQVVAQAGGVGRLLSGFQAEIRANWRHVSLSRMRAAAWRHRGFPIWRVPSQFLMVFSVQAPMLFMAALYDSQTVGQFGLAMMTISVPLSLIARTTSQAFFAEASSLGYRRTAEIKTMLQSVVARLWLVSLPAIIFLLVLGPAFFEFVFGASWVLAGDFAQAISIQLGFHMIFQSASRSFFVYERHITLFFLSALRLALTLVVFSAAHFFSWTPLVTIWITSAVQIAYYTLGTFIAYNTISLNNSKRNRSLVSASGGSDRK